MLSDQFLDTPIEASYPDVEREITERLTAFWEQVFSYTNPTTKPALEDHFTVIDLAANTGHHLGVDYSPRKLRSIRRFSIHRAFRILDLRYNASPVIGNLLERLQQAAELSVVSVNWDIVVENHLRDLGISYYYGSAVKSLGGATQSVAGIPLFKLHGSANWAYCDSCRTLFSSPEWAGKAALHQGTFLEPDDFQTFQSPARVVEIVRELSQNHQICELCGCRVTVADRHAKKGPPAPRPSVMALGRRRSNTEGLREEFQLNQQQAPIIARQERTGRVTVRIEPSFICCTNHGLKD